MNIKEAAERLNLSEVTVRRWIKNGKLQATKVEGRYGPEYDISEDSIEDARNMQRTPVIIQTNEPIASAHEIQRMIDKALSARISAIIDEGNQTIIDEMEALKTEIQAVKDELAAEREKDRQQIEARDKVLLEGIRAIQQRQEEAPKKKSWQFWKRY